VAVSGAFAPLVCLAVLPAGFVPEETTEPYTIAGLGYGTDWYIHYNTLQHTLAAVVLEREFK
jgi:hypothetical protein